MMLVSIIIPSFRAQATLTRAIASLLRQTWADWEAIVVSDDGVDYAAILRAAGFCDVRLRFVSTGKVGSGCHRARNAGFAVARGDFITHLDADDEFTPQRLSQLTPLAQLHGAAVDNLALVADASGELLYRVFDDLGAPRMLDMAAFVRLNSPLVPVVRRDIALPRAEGVELSEDFIANLQILDRIGALPVVAASSYIYRIRQGSIAHSEGSALLFDAAYGAYIERLRHGDGFGLGAVGRQTALDGLIQKRALNLAFAKAREIDPALNFQTFIAKRNALAAIAG